MGSKSSLSFYFLLPPPRGLWRWRGGRRWAAAMGVQLGRVSGPGNLARAVTTVPGQVTDRVGLHSSAEVQSKTVNQKTEGKTTGGRHQNPRARISGAKCCPLGVEKAHGCDLLKGAGGTHFSLTST